LSLHFIITGDRHAKVYLEPKNTCYLIRGSGNSARFQLDVKRYGSIFGRVYT